MPEAAERNHCLGCDEADEDNDAGGMVLERSVVVVTHSLALVALLKH